MSLSKERHSRVIFLLFFFLFVVSIFSNYQISGERSREDLPAVSLGNFLGTVVLSGFRPLAVDLLWMKADDLLMKRQYYELLSVYEMIATLDPHFESAWVFNSFNLSFRLSYLETDAKAQWEWVRQGIVFAQKGYEKNPSSSDICFAIAWIYYNRIPQNPLFEEFLREDAELNPNKSEPFQIAMMWAERGFAIKPHTVFIDWVLEFIYRHYAQVARHPQESLFYQRKRLNLWNYFISQNPEMKRAKEKLREVETAIAELTRQIQKEE